MNPGAWAILGLVLAVLAFALLCFAVIARSPELFPDDHDGLSDDERAAFAILREAGE